MATFEFEGIKIVLMKLGQRRHFRSIRSARGKELSIILLLKQIFSTYDSGKGAVFVCTQFQVCVQSKLNFVFILSPKQND